MAQKAYLYVASFFPGPENWRGAYGYDFVQALRRMGRYRVEVFKEGDGLDYEVGGIVVHTFKVWRLPSNILPALFAKRNMRSFVSAVRRVGIDLSDIVVCHGNTVQYGIYPMAIKALNPDCKTLLHHHCLSSFGLQNGILHHCWPYNMIQFPILRRIHEQVDCHVFISEASRRSFLAAPDAGWTVHEDYRLQMRGLPYHPARIKKSVVLHNGVDKKIFFGEGRVSAKDGAFVIGCVGNFQQLKGQVILLEAVDILRTKGVTDLKVIFVGSGAMLDKCRRFAAQKELNVEFRREVEHAELVRFYRGLDLFVLPSYFEGFGCVYTEAHSCGVPFIACRGQGIEDILADADKDKWLCEPKNAADLADKIGAYIQNRWTQTLTEDQDIDKLVERFIEQIGK